LWLQKRIYIRIHNPGWIKIRIRDPGWIKKIRIQNPHYYARIRNGSGIPTERIEQLGEISENLKKPTKEIKFDFMRDIIDL
jgi:hypothetical protein